jgi:imidazolonepropionase-like amidohydrolase
MKKIFQLITIIATFSITAKAQETVYPANKQTGLLFITHGNVHVGNGVVIPDGTIQVNNGKIEKVGANIPASGTGKIIDARGKEVYPGLIAPNTDLGLKEVANGVRGTNDYNELGDINPSIRSVVAYNTDSKVINVLRANGILLANIVPQDAGGARVLISGSSSVVQLDAWNWEDAAYRMDGNIHFNMPSIVARTGRFGGGGGQRFGLQAEVDPVKQALDQIEKVKSFFREAKAYLNEPSHKETNLKFEATKGLFDRKQKFFVHCNAVKEMLLAIDFSTEFGFDVVVVGGNDSWQIADLLKQNNIAVVLDEMHSLPVGFDDDVDQPYKTPYILQRAGVLFAIGDKNEETRGRNLMFNAGTAAAYGLTKEEALGAITLNTAKILGVSDITGSLEAGKDANIVISTGDILDMKSSIITNALIQGREIELTNKQTQLYERYKYKYGLK